MISMSLEEIAVAVSGEIYKGKPETLVSGVCDTDSRKIEPGGIFFAKLGESEDGHKYLVDAALSGAALAIVSTPKKISRPIRLLLLTQSQPLASSPKQFSTGCEQAAS
jgi:UDP-N-acetylmuramoyl-tripeptide--D-alanyl-D-alanine ligase